MQGNIKETEAPQMAFGDAMEVTQSPPQSWEDRVQQEEDKQERCSSTGGDSQPCPSSPQLEDCDISMAEEGQQQQCDSDIMVEEESMDTNKPLGSSEPALLLEKAFLEGLKAEVEED